MSVYVLINRPARNGVVINPRTGKPQVINIGNQGPAGPAGPATNILLPVGAWDMSGSSAPVTLASAAGCTVNTSAAPALVMTPGAGVVIGPEYASAALGTANALDGNVGQMSMVLPVSGGNLALAVFGVVNSGTSIADLISALIYGPIGTCTVFAYGRMSSPTVFSGQLNQPSGVTALSAAISASAGATLYFAVNTATGALLAGVNASSLVSVGGTIALSALPGGQTLAPFVLTLFSGTPGNIGGASATLAFELSATANGIEGFGALAGVAAPANALAGTQIRYVVTAGGTFNGVSANTGDTVEFYGVPGVGPGSTPSIRIDTPGPNSFVTPAQLAAAVIQSQFFAVAISAGLEG